MYVIYLRKFYKIRNESNNICYCITRKFQAYHNIDQKKYIPCCSLSKYIPTSPSISLNRKNHSFIHMKKYV